jgi:hypothetical protein
MRTVTRGGARLPHAARAALAIIAIAAVAAAFASRAGAGAVPSVTLTLLDAGSAPRRVLRYALHTHASVLDLVVQRGRLLLRGVFEGEESYTPPVATLWEVSDVHATHGGRATRFALSLATGRILADDKAPDAFRAELARGLGAAIDARIDATADPTGRLVRFDASPRASSDAAPALFGELSGAIAMNLLLALPDEAVGRGARWRTTQQRRVGALGDVYEDQLVTLEEIDGDRVTVARDVSFRAGRTDLGVIRGEAVRIENLIGSGHGASVYALADVVPIVSDQTWKIDADLRARPVQDAGADAREAVYHVAYEGRERLRVPDEKELEPRVTPP